MKILYINGFVPRENTPMGGIFVTKRIQALRKKGIQVVPYIYGIEYSAAVQKYLAEVRHIPRQSRPISRQLDVEYRIRMAKMGFAGMVTAQFWPSLYRRKIAGMLAEDCEKEQGIDLVHLQWLWPAGAGIRQFCRKSGIPYIVTCHGSEINITMENPRIRKEMLLIMEDAAVVEFISEALLRRAKELGYSGKNAAVVYNGIDGCVFEKTYTKKNEESMVVSFAGNLIPVKGADRLPEIFRRIYAKHNSSVEFHIMGDGQLRKELEKNMKDLPVVFRGQVSQQKLAEEFNQTNVLIAPSRSEGYSCVIKEAQACGAVPVGCDVGGIPEAIGGYGTLVDGTEEEILQKMADIVVEYLEKKRQVNRKEMIEKAAKNTWEHMQELSVELYRKVLGE